MNENTMKNPFNLIYLLLLLLLLFSCEKDDENDVPPSLTVNWINESEFVKPGDTLIFEIEAFDYSGLENLTITPNLNAFNSQTIINHYYATGQKFELKYSYIVPTYVLSELTDLKGINIEFKIADIHGSISVIDKTIATLPIEIHSGGVQNEEIWGNDKIHLVEGGGPGEFIITDVLTIEENTIVALSGGVEVKKNGEIVAKGTKEEPIKFIRFGGNSNFGWGQIEFESGHTESIFEYCIFDHLFGGFNLRKEASVSINNCKYIEPNFVVYGGGWLNSFMDNTIINPQREHHTVIPSDYVHLLGTGNKYVNGGNKELIISVNNTYGVSINGGFLRNQSIPYKIINNNYSLANLGFYNKWSIEEGTEIIANNIAIADTFIVHGTNADPIKLNLRRIYTYPNSVIAMNRCEFYNLEYLTVKSESFSMKNNVFASSESNSFTLESQASLENMENNLFPENSWVLKTNANYVHTLKSCNDFENCQIEVVGDLDNNAVVKWRNLGVPYHLPELFTVGSIDGTILEIEEGVVIKVKESIRIGPTGSQNMFKGSVIANGSVEKPIVFTSNSKTAGSWGGIVIGEDVLPGCLFDYCNIFYAGRNVMNKGAGFRLDKTREDVTISNSHISYSAGYGIYVDSNSTPNIDNNTFSNIADEDIFYE